jgi:hypothetical protein
MGSVRELFAIVEAEPTLTTRELAERTGLSQSMVHRKLRVRDAIGPRKKAGRGRDDPGPHPLSGAYDARRGHPIPRPARRQAPSPYAQTKRAGESPSPGPHPSARQVPGAARIPYA